MRLSWTARRSLKKVRARARVRMRARAKTPQRRLKWLESMVLAMPFKHYERRQMSTVYKRMCQYQLCVRMWAYKNLPGP
jgi:hypothetical protein